MSGNRRRHTNTVQVGSLLKWVVIAFFLGIAGLSYVYRSNQTQRSGTDIGKLENDLKRLKDKNDEAESEDRPALLAQGIAARARRGIHQAGFHPGCQHREDQRAAAFRG